MGLKSMTPSQSAPTGTISATANGQSATPPTPGKQANSTTTQNNIVGVHYKIGKKIGEGSFGIIYEGFELKLISRNKPTEQHSNSYQI